MFRNLRYAESIIAFCGAVFILMIYYANPRPQIQRIGYYICSFFIFISVVLAIIAFCIDVSKTNQAMKCKTNVCKKIPVLFLVRNFVAWC